MTSDRTWATRPDAARDPQVDMDYPAVAELVADVATAVGRQAAAMSEDVYKVILGEIPQLDHDEPLRALLASSIDSNVAACLQIMQHRIDLAAVRAPTVAIEHALLRAWVLTTLAGLATDDEHHARLRDTLLTFLQSGGSYKATAEQMVLHKNTVQYRIRKAEESLGRAAAEDRHDVELALQASRWLGSAVLQPPRERSTAPTGAR